MVNQITPLTAAASFRSIVPTGMLRLVDNRIFVGDSTEFEQPVTLLVLSPKHLKDENVERVQAMIQIVNLALQLHDAAQDLAVSALMDE